MSLPPAPLIAVDDEALFRCVGTSIRQAFAEYCEAGGSYASLAAATGMTARHVRDAIAANKNLEFRTIARLAAGMGLTVRVSLTKSAQVYRPKPAPAAPAATAPTTLHDLIAAAVLPDLPVGGGTLTRARTQKLILHALAEAGGDWTDLQDVHLKTGLHRWTIYRNIRAMRDAGLVEIVERPKKGTPKGAPRRKYTVVADRLVAVLAGTARLAS